VERLTVRDTRRLAGGHLWVFSNEIEGPLASVEPGALVELRSRKGEFLAIAYANPRSLIAARVLTRKRETIDRAWLRARIVDALDYRRALGGSPDSGRLVFAEGDGLPGLVVDRYADVLAVQLLTAGMERMRADLLDILEELLGPRAIVLRNDSSFRTLEGLAEEKLVARGSLDDMPVVTEGGLRFEVDPLAGQKTGFFLDQRENRIAFAELAGGGEGLDAYACTGAWAAHLAARGARVTCIDTSAAALQMAARNAGLNDLQDRIATERGDAATILRARQRAGEQFDFIVLDPPAFAKSRASLPAALKAYRQVNTAAMALLRHGGWLASCSCSHHVDDTAFLEVLRNAARANGRAARLVELRSQARDHPALVAMPETRYLKCAFLQVQ